MSGDTDFQKQFDELRHEVQLARAEARHALAQTYMTRRGSTELVRVALRMLIEPGVIPAYYVRKHLVAALENMGEHRNAPGMSEIAKEIEYLMSKVGDDGEPKGSSTGRRHRLKVVARK